MREKDKIFKRGYWTGLLIGALLVIAIQIPVQKFDLVDIWNQLMARPCQDISCMR